MHKHGRAAQMRDLSVENRQRISISAYIRLFTLWMRIHIKIGKPFGTASFRGETVVTLTADHAYKEGALLGTVLQCSVNAMKASETLCRRQRPLYDLVKERDESVLGCAWA